MGQEASAQKPVQNVEQQPAKPPVKQLHKNDQFAKEAEVEFKRSSAQFADVTVGVGETVGMNLWNHAKWWGQGVVGIVMFLPMMLHVMIQSAKKEEKKHELPAGHPDKEPNFVRESAARQPWGNIQASA